MKTKDLKIFLKYIALSIIIVYFVVNFVTQIYGALEANYFFSNLYGQRYKDEKFLDYLNSYQESSEKQIANIKSIAGDDYPAESAWIGTIYHLAKLDSVKLLIPIIIIGIIAGIIFYTIREFGKTKVISYILIYIIVLLTVFILYTLGVYIYESLVTNVIISDAYTVFEDFVIIFFTPVTVIYLIYIVIANNKSSNAEVKEK